MIKLKELAPEQTWYSFDNFFDNSGIVITGNRHYTDFGDQELVDVIKESESGEEIKNLIAKTGQEWQKVCIKGTMQSEYNYLYYTEHINVKELEAFYFGEIVEFVDEDNISYLVPYYIKNEEIAEYLGLDKNEVEIYRIIGSHTVYDYIKIKDGE